MEVIVSNDARAPMAIPTFQSTSSPKREIRKAFLGSGFPDHLCSSPHVALFNLFQLIQATNKSLLRLLKSGAQVSADEVKG